MEEMKTLSARRLEAQTVKSRLAAPVLDEHNMTSNSGGLTDRRPPISI
jgi:hypothetical protein